MRVLWVVGLLLSTAVAGAQELRNGYDPVNEFSGFVEYANNSSHILIGQQRARKLLGVGGSYARRLRENHIVAWRWQFDVRPLVLLQNPLLTTDETVTALGPPITQVPLGPGAYHFSVLQMDQCKSSSGTGYFYNDGTQGTPPQPVESFTYTSVCTHPWTYGGAISPLGQTLNFLPHRRLQPYFAGNAGFVAFDKVTPSNNATMFNFSFEIGVGVQFFTRPGRAVTADFRYHHISNAYRGQENPGVDSALVKLSYGFGR